MALFNSTIAKQSCDGDVFCEAKNVGMTATSRSMSASVRGETGHDVVTMALIKTD